MKKLNYYSHEKFSDRVYIFTEGYSSEFRFTLGVVVGERKVLVIDAGLGMCGGLRQYVESIAGKEKPIICCCTHGHVDHVGSAIEFDEAYLNERDFEVLPGFGLYEPTRFGDLTAFSCDSYETQWYAIEHYVQNKETKFKNIDDGDVIDLGGVQVEAIRMPGHSKGSLAYYVREEKVCFTGDAVNIQTHLKRFDNAGMREYAEIIERMIDITGEDCTIFSGHMALPQTVASARNLAAACREIADGRIEEDPPAEMIFKNQKNGGERDYRFHYHGNTCVIYNRKNISVEA